MAVTLSVEAQTVFFAKVFGPTHPVTEKVKALLGVGVTFEVSLYAIRATAGKKVLEPVKLTYGTTALIKGTADVAIVVQNKKLIEDWVSFLHAKQGHPTVAPKVPTTPWIGATSVVLTGLQEAAKLLPVIKVVHQLLGKTLLEAKQLVEQAKAGTTVTVVTFPTYDGALMACKALVAAGGVSLVKSGAGQKVLVDAPVAAPKPVAEVIHLRDAAALGQKVHGTNPQSVYYTIAIGDHVKVAARMSSGGSISIRAEWDALSEADKTKLEASGVEMKGSTHGSIHFDAEQVPVQRVIGAFLLGTGISWKQVVTNGAELVVGS